MKNFLLATTLILSGAMAFAQDQSDALVIATGKPGGGYDKASQAAAVRMGQRGWTGITVLNTKGSDEITLAACNGKADIFWAQIDAIYARALDGCNLEPVVFNGEEYAILMFPPESDNSKLKHLTSEDRIAVDGIGSGTELFWKTIVGIENGDNGTQDTWATAQKLNVDLKAKTLISAAKSGKITVAIFVRSKSSPDIQTLLGLGWTMGEFYDKDVNDELFNDKPLYESREVSYKHENKNVYGNYVYVVNSFVGVSPEHAENDELKSDLTDSVE